MVAADFKNLITGKGISGKRVEGHGFSRAKRRNFKNGFSPGQPWLEPLCIASDFAGLKARRFHP